MKSWTLVGRVMIWVLCKMTKDRHSQRADYKLNCYLWYILGAFVTTQPSDQENADDADKMLIFADLFEKNLRSGVSNNLHH